MSLNATCRALPAATVGAEVLPADTSPDRARPPAYVTVAEVFSDRAPPPPAVGAEVSPDQPLPSAVSAEVSPAATVGTPVSLPILSCEAQVGSKHPNDASCLRAVWTYTEFHLIGKACQDIARGYPKGTVLLSSSYLYKLSSLVSGKIPQSVNLCALVLKALRGDRNAVEHFHARHIEDSGRLQHGPQLLALTRNC